MSGVATEREPALVRAGAIGDAAPARWAVPLTRAVVRSRAPGWKDALRRRLLAAADVLAAIAAAVALGTLGSGEATALVCATLPVWVVVAKINGLYDRDHTRLRHQTVDELAQIFHAVTISSALTLAALALVSGHGLSVPEAAVLWGVAFALTFLLRALARRIWRRAVPPERGLVVGSGELAGALARKLALEGGHHLWLAGTLAFDGDRDEALDALAARIADGRHERVILAFGDLDETTVSRVLAACRATGVKLSVAPPLRATLGTAVQLNHLAELPLIEFRTWDPSRSTMALKRALDVVGAALALIAVSPVLAVALVAIRLESPGSPLFRQRRAGRDGVPFTMLKLRTMVADAEDRLAEVIDVDALDEPVFKLADDPRVTRVGRILRRFSIDELPQLVNVLRGDMSLVGPRPEEVWLTLRYSPAEAVRLSVRPGITGPMQVHGRGQLTLEERVAVEREYIENYSLRRDLEILLRTVPAVLAGRGAY